MAKVSTKGEISGAVGPVTYRVLNGKNIIQSRSGKDTRTNATKKAAQDFGHASRVCRQIRRALEPITAGFENAYMPSRLSGLIYKATNSDSAQLSGARRFSDGDISLLEGFQFNTFTPFDAYCRIQTEILKQDNGTITISFPEGNVAETLTVIPGSAEAELCILLTVLDPEAANNDLVHPYLHAEVFRTTLNLKQPDFPAQSWITKPIAANKLVVVASALFYFRKDNLMGSIAMNGKTLHPCEITKVLKS